MEEGVIVEVWESYGHGREYTAWKTEEQAKNHELYAIDFTGKAEILLNAAELVDLENGVAIYE